MMIGEYGRIAQHIAQATPQPRKRRYRGPLIAIAGGAILALALRVAVDSGWMW